MLLTTTKSPWMLWLTSAQHLIRLTFELCSKSFMMTGIKETLLKWVESYLTQRTMKVVTDNSSSKTEHLKFGVPQGSCAGPVIFTMYRSAQEKSSFFAFTFATKILKREVLRRKRREISRKFAQPIFILRDNSRRYSAKTRGETLRNFAEKTRREIREISQSFSAKFRADTPQNTRESFQKT